MSNVFICIKIFLRVEIFFLSDWFDSKYFDLYQAFFLPLLGVFHAFWYDSWFLELYHCWVESYSFESYHEFFLELFFKVLIRFRNLWIISTFIWAGLIWITYNLICINLHSYIFTLFHMFDTIQNMCDSIQHIVFGKTFALVCHFYIQSIISKLPNNWIICNYSL